MSSPLAAYARERGAQRVEVTPNAVAPERFSDLPPRDPSAPPVAVFSGALRPWHGIETIAEAWALLDGEAPRLRVIGDGPARDIVAAAGAEMLGAVPHEQVPRLLGEADIGLAPYSPDAPAYFSPLKLFEYLAAGLAIVAADIPGVRDVTGSEAAVLIPPGDAPALAREVAVLARRSRRARAPRLRSSGAGCGAHLAAARAAHHRSRQGALGRTGGSVTRGRRKRAVDSPTTLTVLRPYVRQQWPPLLVAAIATLVIAAADVASPLPLAYLIDHVLTVGGKGTEVDLSDFSRSDYFTIGYVGLAVLGIAAAEAIATYQSDLRLELAGERIIHELRLAIYSQLQRLSISFHARLQTGDLVTRVTGDVNAIGDIFAGSLGALVSSFLIFLLMLGASLYIDPVLALCAFAVTPVLALLSFWFRKRARVSSRQMRSREGEIASISGEVLGAIREVQAFGSEEYERARLEAKSAERWHAGIRASRLEGRFAGMIDFASEIGIALVLVVGAYRVHSGDLKLGLLTVMVMYAGKVYRPLSAIARQGSRISKALARADRVAEILAADDVLDDPQNGYNGRRATGEIQLDDVVFGYDREHPALHGLSLFIPAGQRVAVIGRSGAGKSTLAALIARFYDPFDGSVLIDGHDLRECRLRWVRNQVGLVLQEGVLFTGTIADNIAYGIEAEPEQIVAAAKAAAAHEFIEKLPDGYATMLGQRGVGSLGRPASADRDCPHDPAQPADPRARRADDRSRRRERGGRDGGPRCADARAYRDHDHAFAGARAYRGSRDRDGTTAASRVRARRRSLPATCGAFATRPRPTRP